MWGSNIDYSTTKERDNMPKENMHQKANRLINEKSPYLLQHAYNPVDWYSWGEEAFNKAKTEDKPIFLSIGYSTCHWCHVMSHESFEDERVAELMNDTFVSIKVDREERPDIDGVYMAVCQMMTGSGGWPLTIIMTPDKKPFFAATYLPRESRYGRMGMMELAPRVKELWEKNRRDIVQSADRITNSLQEVRDDREGDMPGREILEKAYKNFSRSFDKVNGGFGKAPKFPTPHNLMFLLRYWRRSGEREALDIVTKTLDSMAMGGIFDHVGYGFHRYSTDSKWLLPHFEKMLYDQALIAMSYTEAYQASGNEEYKKMAERIYEYLKRDMLSPEGGFYSAEDADSEGEEGKFYVWSIEEIKEVLGEEDSKFAIEIYNLSEQGNFKEEATGERRGLNILHMKKPVSIVGEELGFENIEDILNKVKKSLFEHRNKRVRPGRDDKILADWNGLIIAALAKSSVAFGNSEYGEMAKKTCDFIIKGINDNGRLMHRYKDGEWSIPRNVDDYSFVIWGMLELYEAVFEVKYLRTAIELMDELIKHFWDEEAGGFYFTSSDAEALIMRNKEVYDGAVPSGNSAALLNLIRLSRITGESRYEELAHSLIKAFSGTVSQMPYGYSHFLCGIDFVLGPTYEVVISGKKAASDTEEMIRALNNRFIPEKVVVFNPIGENTKEINEIAQYTSGQEAINGKATAYVCMNYACKRPTNSVEEMIEHLNI